MSVRTDGDNWTIGFLWQNETETLPTDTATSVGYLDPLYRNIGQVDSFERLASDTIPQNLVVRFFPVNDPSKGSPNRYLYDTKPRAVEPEGVVVPNGEETRYVVMDFVRSWRVADRIGNFLHAWLEKDKRISVGELASELRSQITPKLSCGARVTLDAPAMGVSAVDYRIFGEERRGDSFGWTLHEDARTEALAYTATTEVDILQPDSIGDYKHTSPPAPTSFHAVSFAHNAEGTITTLKFTMPTGNIADEAMNGAEVAWQRRDADSDKNYEWERQFIPARSGDVITWVTRDFIIGRTYAVSVISKSPWNNASAPAQTAELGITVAPVDPGDTPPAGGESGKTELILVVPTPTIHTVDSGIYGYEQLRDGAGKGAVYMEQLAVSEGAWLDNTVELAFTPELAPRTPVMIVNGMPWIYDAAASARGEFSIVDSTVTFSGGVPNGTLVIAIYIIDSAAI